MQRSILLIVLLGMLPACGASPADYQNLRSGDQPTLAVASGATLAAKAADWHPGWDKLIKGGGGERILVPNDGETPETIKATPMKNPDGVRLLDYWIRPTGWTTMFGHALEKYDDASFRTDGVRWDTPTTWVPKLASGRPSGGNLTLMTQFGPEIPSYWAGAEPLAPQTEWIFHVNYDNGGIMEIFDRQHFAFGGDRRIRSAFSEVVAEGYYQSLYWSPAFTYPVANDYAFAGKAKFRGSAGEVFLGYSSVEVVNRYETFTVPPARNTAKDCAAAEFKDVVAVKHRQFWWDPKTRTSRADYIVVYMAKNVGWIYMLINSGVTFNADGSQRTKANPLTHLSPRGYVDQSAGGKRICAAEFRDLVLKR